MVNSSNSITKIFQLFRQQFFFFSPMRKSPINTRQFFLRQIAFLLPLFITVAVLSFYCGSEEPFDLFMQNGVRNTAFYNAMVMVSSGNIIGYTLYAMCLIWALVTKKSLNAWFVFYYLSMQCVIGLCAVYALKVSVGRPRPLLGECEHRFFSLASKYHSFPSGHVTEICGAIGPFAQRAYPYVCSFLWGLIPAAIGFSRIYLGAHYRTDVLGGAIIGSFTTYAIMHFWLIKKEQLEQQEKK